MILGELWFTIALMLIGATTFSYITATVSSVIADSDVRSTKFRVKMTALLQFMRRTELSQHLKNTVTKQMARTWRNPERLQVL